jgi:uncharacterized membrane protein YccC
LPSSRRTDAGLAIAFLLARLGGLQHGFWVELATLTVIRSTARSTSRQAGRALAGTTPRSLVSFRIIVAAGSGAAAYTVLMPVAIAVAIYARSAVNFLAGQAGFTVAVIVLFSLLQLAGWRIGVVRLEDVLAGVLAGFAASVIAWPRGATAGMAPAVAGLFDAAAGYLRDVVYAVTRHQQPEVCGPAEEPGVAQASGKVHQAASVRPLRACEQNPHSPSSWPRNPLLLPCRTGRRTWRRPTDSGTSAISCKSCAYHQEPYCTLPPLTMPPIGRKPPTQSRHGPADRHGTDLRAP